AAARHMALPELSGQSGTEQQPVLAGLLEEAAATGDYGGAGVCRHLFHLRPAALGNARPAGIHRGAGGLQFPHPPGPAGSIESGIRLLPTDRGSGTYPHPGSDGHAADPPGGLSSKDPGGWGARAGGGGGSAAGNPRSEMVRGGPRGGPLPGGQEGGAAVAGGTSTSSSSNLSPSSGLGRYHGAGAGGDIRPGAGLLVPQR